ncbi:cysteine dioxygenase family protein [uncultured Shewanella sp.]|uniref:cysteine dioxygenase n=1 Tax=uncultured Shewanella sp. TaxID=173975 RepID=UPI00260A7DD9|nr:cysteine dioxygenase family protein [uncultured Shewanella sp.]
MSATMKAQLQQQLTIPKIKTIPWQQQDQITQTLLIKGQGVADITLHENLNGRSYESLPEKVPLTFEIHTPNQEFGLKLDITQSAAILYELISHSDFGKTGKQWQQIKVNDSPLAGIDADPNCPYWFSIDGPNNRVSYGKGEMRQCTTLLTFQLPDKLNEEQKLKEDQLKDVKAITIHTLATQPTFELWREPVTIDPSLIVVDSNALSMIDLASNAATVAANLTPACQTIYANISGNNFVLNTEDFPYFTDAIEQSIRDPEGWCYKKLREKAEHESFGGEDALKGTYLRITMGVNQGNSPGIPNVLEIWPPGHHSPIHNHGHANAIIRVLHGEIQVDLYAMLSTKHTTPFASQTFKKDQVTWLSPGLNQTHKLTNANLSGPTCMTIQSYLYGKDNNVHYEYFDFIDESAGVIEPFTPNSDMGFIQFKQTMKEEWLQRNTPHSCCNEPKL